VRVARRIGALAGNTFREAVRNKLLYNLLLFAVLMIASSVIIADLHLGHAERIYLDFGLSAIALFGTLIAIFVGINLVYREISLKTVYTLLAKPVHRWEFLLGKYAGLVALLFVEIAIMGGCFLVLLILQDAEVTSSIVLAIGMIWIIGHLLADLRAFGEHSEIASLQRLTEVLYWTLPNLDRVDIKSLAAAGHPLESAQLAVSALYAAGYSTMLLLASVVLFRRRDFR
jgi:ABC-type transport system involved in multi-copper enzyme maturation permease subunit